MDDERFDALFDEFRVSAFRLETLPAYDVPEEQTDLESYLAGEPLPMSEDEEWLGFLSSAKDAGKAVQRVRLLPPKLTAYLRFEIEWGYVFNDRAGEDIRFVLPRSEEADQWSSEKDFWLFDDETAVVMDYDAQGAYIGAREVTDANEMARFVHARDEFIARSISLREFLELYRSGQIV